MFILKKLWLDESGVERIEYAMLAGLCVLLTMAFWDAATQKVAILISPTFNVHVIKIACAILAVAVLGVLVLPRKRNAE